MPDCMSFPDNIMDFIDDYSFEDSDHVYTNGSKLIQSFRVRQALEHYILLEQAPVKPTWRHGLVFCGKCGRNFGRGFKYCPDCGRAVKWDAPSD